MRRQRSAQDKIGGHIRTPDARNLAKPAGSYGCIPVCLAGAKIDGHRIGWDRGSSRHPTSGQSRTPCSSPWGSESRPRDARSLGRSVEASLLVVNRVIGKISNERLTEFKWLQSLRFLQHTVHQPEPVKILATPLILALPHVHRFLSQLFRKLRSGTQV